MDTPAPVSAPPDAPPVDRDGPPHGSVLYMNLTPMIDMVFNLLIFFVMVAGGTGEDHYLHCKMPRVAGGGHGPSQVEQHLTLRLVRVGRGIEEQACQFELVEPWLRAEGYEGLYRVLLAQRERVGAEVLVAIEPRPDVRYVHAVNAYNAAVRAGFKTVAFSAAD